MINKIKKINPVHLVHPVFVLHFSMCSATLVKEDSLHSKLVEEQAGSETPLEQSALSYAREVRL